MPHKLHARLDIALIWLALASVAGCGQSWAPDAYFTSWRQSRSGAAAPSTAKSPLTEPAAGSAVGEPAAKSKSVEFSGETDQRQAAAEARRALLKAQSAAEAAEKASAAAVEASKQAEQAAARAGNVSLGPVPATNFTSTEPAKISSMVLSSAGHDAVDKNRAQSKELIYKLDQAIGKIDRTKLDADGTKRADLAEQLLRGAQKALGQDDYVAASSLATKASVVLAPLIDRTGEPIPASSVSNRRLF
jgi:hypothetical protein